MDERRDELLKARTLFESEYTRLEKLEEYLSKELISKEELLQIFLMLVEEHKRVLKDSVKLTIISDRIDAKLMKTNDELRTAHEKIVKLEKKNSALAMAVTASHELNQPLTVLSGYLELFQCSFEKETLTKKQEQYLNKIRSSLKELQTILAKYTAMKNIHFEEYLGNREMVVFDDD